MALASTDQVTETSILLKGLRQELKDWEASFHAANNRKPGREDIKQHPEIGTKYKAYNELRYPSSRPSAHGISTPSGKRRHPSSTHAPPPSVTPNKRPKTARPQHPSNIDPYDPPASTLFSPIAHRTSIGPTPQKNGVVLGLFDALSSSSSHSKTPSKRAQHTSAVTASIQATPSKRSQPPTSDDAEPLSTHERQRRSPLSASKQTQLNTFLTPSATRILKNGTPTSQRRSVSKLRFDETPAFLRRDNSQRMMIGKENGTGLDGDDDISWSPVVVRRLPSTAYAGKGLSALVKGLRDMEDERLDEELNMLREIKGGNNASSMSINKDQHQKILVDDSQNRSDIMPLGPDGDHGDSEDEMIGENEGKGRDGRPLKVWKKKGQKRTTRKVIMRPNVAKWVPEPAWKHGRGSEDEEEEACVEETQVSGPSADGERQDCDLDLRGVGNEIQSRRSKSKRTEAAGSKEEEGVGKMVTRVKKKISATAHANFRALKIKNKQSKGKQGGRFGRKR